MMPIKQKITSASDVISGPSKICREALVANLETSESWPYADLYAEGETKRNEVRRQRGCLAMGDIANSGAEVAYLIIWQNGVVAHILADKKPYQLTPEIIEKAYSKATRIKPLIIDKKGVF
jgi:hypothetical protein